MSRTRDKNPVLAELAMFAILAALWALFFWRALTPNPNDHVTFEEGDFSGQFYSFGAYQAARLLSGEIPLWNPYATAGHPFLADVQAAVFYPPRLLTIVLSGLSGGWSYEALQTEAVLHFLLTSLLMYAFVRRLTGSRLAGLLSAIAWTYGGYLTGYPPLQLAVLETVTWTPMVMLGILEGTRDGKLRPACLALSGIGIGLAIHAGHSQSGLFLIYSSLAWLVYRAYVGRMRWQDALGAWVLIGAIGVGLGAVQLLPGMEYLRLTTRSGLGFDSKTGGFPFYDVAQMVIPGIVSLWSPLYVSVTGLALAGLALAWKTRGARFWGITALVALGLSFGGQLPIYHVVYLLVPGFGLFRGQERAAYVVSFALSVLIGLGAVALESYWRSHADDPRPILTGLMLTGLVVGVLTGALFLLWLKPEDDTWSEPLSKVTFALFAVWAAWALFKRLTGPNGPAWRITLVALIALELFGVNMGRGFEPIPAGERPHLPWILVDALRDETADVSQPFRIDGEWALGGNYGTLLGFADIMGASPLHLATLDYYLTYLPRYEVWELLGVRYLFAWDLELEVPTEVLGLEETPRGAISLHELTDPRPMALMMYDVWTVPEDGIALELLRDPGRYGLDLRNTVVITGEEPALELPDEPPDGAEVRFTTYAPEYVEIEVDTPADGVLRVSEGD